MYLLRNLLLFYLFLSVCSFSQISIVSKFDGFAKAGEKGELEVKINKNTINSFAKYQVEVPAGVYISDIDVKGGNFLMEENKGKVIWVNLPSENIFTIRLKIHFKDDVVFPVTLYQKFYYLENSVKKEIQSDPLVINLAHPIAVQVKEVQSPQKEVQVNIRQNTENMNIEKKEALVEKNKKTSDTSIQKEEIKKTMNEKTTDNHLADVYTYKIQVAASANAPNESDFTALGKVEIVKHKGMYKVIIDKIFTSKEDILKYREEVIQKGFTGAFIVKYFNGQRAN